MAKRQSRKVEDETPVADETSPDAGSPSVEVSGEQIPIVEMKAEEVPVSEEGDETTKEQGEGEIAEMSLVDEVLSADEIADLGVADAEEEAEKPAKEHEKHDPVRVRVLAEQGLLAGKAVWRGEVHRVVYWQYLQAHGANPDGYELVE